MNGFVIFELSVAAFCNSGQSVKRKILVVLKIMIHIVDAASLDQHNFYIFHFQIYVRLQDDRYIKVLQIIIMHVEINFL